VSLLSGSRLVAVDTETTGFDPAAGHELVEVACVTITDGEPGETWSSLVRPSRPVPADAVRVHGITDAMVAGAPPPADVAAGLRGACGVAPLVFHNAPFDLPFLAVLLRAGGLAPLDNPVIDTLGLARGILSSSENSLSALARRLELPPETAHRAAGDARTTARLFVKLAGLWEGKVGSIAELAAASQDVLRRTRRGPDRPPAVRVDRPSGA
jgi:DNA polymerase-3 subunit epsilon